MKEMNAYMRRLQKDLLSSKKITGPHGGPIRKSFEDRIARLDKAISDRHASSSVNERRLSRKCIDPRSMSKRSSNIVAVFRNDMQVRLVGESASNFVAEYDRRLYNRWVHSEHGRT